MPELLKPNTKAVVWLVIGMVVGPKVIALVSR